MTIGKVEVVGLRDFQRELRRVDKDLPKALRLVNLAAAEVVAADARSKASALGGVAAKAGASVKAQAQQRAGIVRLGGNRYPFAMGAEFGAIRYRQFKAWRGSGADAGYFLYPAKRAKTPLVVAMYGDMVEDLAKKAFPN